jgi:hypothetical protein
VTFFAFLHSFEFYTVPEEEEASVPMYEFHSINYALESKEKVALLAGECYSDEDGEGEEYEYKDELHI